MTRAKKAPAADTAKVIVGALERCETLLDATVRFIDGNPVAEYGVLFDEAECDGYCLADDCRTHLEEVRIALALARGGKKAPAGRRRTIGGTE